MATVAAVLVLARSSHIGVAATMVALLGGLPGLYLMWAAYRDDRQAEAGSGIENASLPAVADQLAAAVRTQWASEAAIRRLNDPLLPVRWLAADPRLYEEWPSLVSLAARGAGWPEPASVATWAASTAELAGVGSDIASVLARVPTGRLVILGAAGAGKSMLLVRLVLDLLAHRNPGEPVPLLVSLAAWDPSGHDLREWLAVQMSIDHPALAAPAPAGSTGSTLARALLARELILPVLDGLDEIPDTLRSTAIARINDALRPGEPVVVSSRSAAYMSAVRPPQQAAVTLRGAAVVELCPVDAGTAGRYLLQDAGDPARWAPVLPVLGTNAPAGQALATPLMLSLAREIYNPRPGEHAGKLPDPAELCRSAKATRSAVERHLLEAFIPAVYRPHPDPSRRCRWSVGQAQHYLAFLADHLEGTNDLAWWSLSEPGATPARGLRWSPGSFKAKLVLAPAIGVIIALVFALAGKPTVALGGGLACCVVCCLAIGLQAAPADLKVAAAPGAILARDRSTFLTFGLLMGPLTGLAVGLVLGLAAPGGLAAGTGLASGPQTMLVTGLVIGPIAWLVFTLVFNAATGAVFGLVIGMVDWLVSWLLGQLLGARLVTPMTSGLLIGVVVGLLFGAKKAAWPAFFATQCRLALRGRLPWHLMRFLADAHRRGVLRQAGAVYQFRHAQLQQSLTTQKSSRT